MKKFTEIHTLWVTVFKILNKNLIKKKKDTHIHNSKHTCIFIIIHVWLYGACCRFVINIYDIMFITNGPYINGLFKVMDPTLNNHIFYTTAYITISSTWF